MSKQYVGAEALLSQITIKSFPLMAEQVRKPERGHRRKLEEGLDEALNQTFPASDPFSVGQVTGTEPPSRPADRKAPRIDRDERGPRRRRRVAG